MRYVILLVPLLALFALACNGGGEAQPTATPEPEVTAEAEATATAEPAAETLAFLREGDIWLIDADGSNERRLGLTGVLSFSWISSDEIDVIAREDRPKHLLVDVEGNVQELFFPGDFDVAGGLSSAHARGSWSPAGRLFVVPVGERLIIYDRNGNQVRQLEVELPSVPDDPMGFKTFCDEPGLKQENAVNVFGSPVFTPDGKDVLVAVFCSRSAEGVPGFPRNTYSRLYRVSLDSGVVEPLPLDTNLRSDSRPRLSPDGSRIALPGSSWSSICDYGFGLSLANADGTNVALPTLPELQELYREADSTVVGGGILGGLMGFDWSPTSDAIVESFEFSICKDFGAEPFLAGLYIQKLDGSPHDKLVEGATRSPAWSPSGRYIAYIAQGFFGEETEPPIIRLFDLTTRQVIDLGQGDEPAWQPQS